MAASRRRALMYLLDTNILSEARRGTPQTVNWLRSADAGRNRDGGRSVDLSDRLDGPVPHDRDVFHLDAADGCHLR